MLPPMEIPIFKEGFFVFQDMTIGRRPAPFPSVVDN